MSSTRGFGCRSPLVQVMSEMEAAGVLSAVGRPNITTTTAGGGAVAPAPEEGGAGCPTCAAASAAKPPGHSKNKRRVCLQQLARLRSDDDMKIFLICAMCARHGARAVVAGHQRVPQLSTHPPTAARHENGSVTANPCYAYYIGTTGSGTEKAAATASNSAEVTHAHTHTWRPTHASLP